MDKTVFNYHPVTGEFTGAQLADESPLEPGTYLIPAYATELAPPAVTDRLVAVYRDGAWSIVPEIRGQWYDDQGQSVEVTTLDADVRGLTRQPRPDADYELAYGRWVLNSPKRRENKAARLRGAVQSHLDQSAQARGYDSILSAVSYADEAAVPRFQAEGLAFRAWRSQVWAACYELLADVNDGQIVEPASETELIALLPTLELPE